MHYHNNQASCFRYWHEIYTVERGRAVITKAVDFLPNLSFAHHSTVYFAQLNYFYKYGNRFGEVSEPKLKKNQ